MWSIDLNVFSLCLRLSRYSPKIIMRFTGGRVREIQGWKYTTFDDRRLWTLRPTSSCKPVVCLLRPSRFLNYGDVRSQLRRDFLLIDVNHIFSGFERTGNASDRVLVYKM